MNKEKTTKDKFGNLVRIGDSIRLLSIEWSGISGLGEQEHDDLKSMIGEVFAIEKIEENGSAWILKWWDRDDGQKESHSLVLAPAEMERVSANEEQRINM